MIRQKLDNREAKTFGTFAGTPAVEGLEARLFLSAVKPHAAHAARVHAAVKMPAVTTPGAFTATATSATSVQLNWANVTAATGYNVLRAITGKKAVVISKLASGVTAFSDTSVQSNHAYSYQVQAFSTSKTAPASKAITITTPLGAPSNLDGQFGSASIQLNWTNTEPSATGYLVLRSSDAVNFLPLAKLSGGAIHGYTDNTIQPGQAYDYEVEAIAGTKTSQPSNIVFIAPAGSPDSISIITRFDNELVITATGPADTLILSQSGSTLTLIANGATFTSAVPAAAVFVYTRGGFDSVSITSSVTVRTTVDSIDAANTSVTSKGTNVSVWMDSTDTFSGAASVHSVAAFAGGVSKAAGASLADPSDSGATHTADLSLFGGGPFADDVNQGGIGDCYFLSSLAAFAGTNPAKLSESAVDLGDGTFAVQFTNSQNKPVFVRVSNNFANGGFDGYAFAQPGANNTIWAMVMEKAFAYFRTGENTYASIDAGWMGEAYSSLGVGSTFLAPSSFSESSFYSTVSNDLASKKPVTLAALNAPDMVNDHAYTLVSASKDVNGTTHYVVRNPWGVSGDSLEDSHGYATLTFAQLVANFSEGCAAA